MEAGAKLAVIGGTFDPVHYGHLIAAEHARVQLDIDKVIFIPTGRPPHKISQAVTDWEHRLMMLQLATSDNPAFEISSLEEPGRGFSYTIDTIHRLRSLNPATAIYFLMGADALLTIDTWKDYQQLIALCSFVVVTRPQYVIDRSNPVLADLPEEWWLQMRQVEIPAMDISSTDIRRRVAAGRTIKYLLPGLVEEYIFANDLYRGGMET